LIMPPWVRNDIGVSAVITVTGQFTAEHRSSRAVH
jgi:hypothetical protein